MNTSTQLPIQKLTGVKVQTTLNAGCTIPNACCDAKIDNGQKYCCTRNAYGTNCHWYSPPYPA